MRRLPTTATRKVPLRFVVGRHARVELFGELTDWLHGIPLSPVEGDDGTYGVDRELPRGAYQYKLLVDGAWWLPADARTRTIDGSRNGVLVVDGTSEPVLFAPALPFVHAEPSGHVVVTAGLRKGTAKGLSVLWREASADPWARTRLVPFVDEAEHDVVRGELPASTARLELLFELDDGRRVGDVRGEPLSWQRPDDEVPSWLREGVVYTIVVDRFRPGHDHEEWDVDPGPDRPAGGDLEGIRRSLDGLADLGVTILHLTPVHVAATCHRYDVVDPLVVDPLLGGETALARLLDDAHARGLRVLLDFSFVHVGRGFPAYEDVLAHGRASRFAAWFQWDEAGPRNYGRRRDAPLLDLRNPEVRALALDATRRWAERGVDGFRFDAVADVPLDLAREVRSTLRRTRPNAVVLGEVVPAHAFRWVGAGAVDVATSFSFHGALTDFVARRTLDARGFVDRLRAGEVLRGGSDAFAVHFASTHDHPRLASMAKLHGDVRRAPVGLLLLATLPGIPALVYGEELGLSSEHPVHEPENAWGDRVPMPWKARDDAHRSMVRRLLRARAESAALRTGATEILFAEGPILVLRRRAAGEVVDVAVNASDEPMELDLDDTELDVLTPIAQVGAATVRGQTVVLGACAGVVARRSESEAAASRTIAAMRAQPTLRDLELARGVDEVACRPTRIDFAVTERCNLRCRHCIALAPERTESGAARTLSRPLLDRLAEDLAYASYFGFVHGGEALTAPIFWEVLSAIRWARRGEPYVVHLLSNGLSLDRRTCERLFSLGVSSLSVSLDGATAITNDRIRASADGRGFDRIVENLRAISALRAERGVDVRLGISVVVVKSNLGELVALARLAHGLGADWIKLEEPVAATEFARSELVDVGSAEVRDAVAAALAEARALGMVAVDHVAPPPVWRCTLDREPVARAFLEADEHANRCTIHPCRAPWERACVHPSGDVSVDDFLQPVVGSLATSTLLDLWRSPMARELRRRTREGWICGGDVTCVGGRAEVSGLASRRRGV